ncbi:MAG TPA: hypothetical protein VLG76_05750 [Rhabdochlamydiaceae bacterium]|nr:hypothetical protein [Rhabdochlamydiaceae bacterium]
MSYISMDIMEAKVCPYLKGKELACLKGLNKEFNESIKNNATLQWRIDEVSIRIWEERQAVASRGFLARAADISARGWDIMPPGYD